MIEPFGSLTHDEALAEFQLAIKPWGDDDEAYEESLSIYYQIRETLADPHIEPTMLLVMDMLHSINSIALPYTLDELEPFAEAMKGTPALRNFPHLIHNLRRSKESDLQNEGLISPSDLAYRGLVVALHEGHKKAEQKLIRDCATHFTREVLAADNELAGGDEAERKSMGELLASAQETMTPRDLAVKLQTFSVLFDRRMVLQARQAPSEGPDMADNTAKIREVATELVRISPESWLRAAQRGIERSPDLPDVQGRSPGQLGELFRAYQTLQGVERDILQSGFQAALTDEPIRQPKAIRQAIARLAKLDTLEMFRILGHCSQIVQCLCGMTAEQDTYLGYLGSESQDEVHAELFAVHQLVKAIALDALAQGIGPFRPPSQEPDRASSDKLRRRLRRRSRQA